MYSIDTACIMHLHCNHSVCVLASQAAAEDNSESDSEQPAAPQQPELLTPAQYRRKFQMWVDAPDAPDPCQTFEQAELPAPLLNAVSMWTDRSGHMMPAGVVASGCVAQAGMLSLYRACDYVCCYLGLKQLP
jgi:hypothetical protein